MPLAGTHIVGHEQRRAALKQLLASNKLPSSMLFAGASGIGKLLVAGELCRTLVCDANSEFLDGRAAPESLVYGGCSNCKSCRLFDVGNSPDLHFVQCLDKENSTIAKLRELLYTLNLNSFSGKRRLVVFDNAEFLSVQAANALLKTLEEPRPDTHYILVTASPARLPATLRSRCQIWFFDALKKPQLQTIIAELREQDRHAAIAHVPVDDLILLSDGSLDGLTSIAEDFPRWEELRERLDEIASGNVALAVEYANQLAKEKDQLRRIFQLMRIFARQKLREQAATSGAASWALFLSNLLSAERLILERNLAPAAVLITLFAGLNPRSSLQRFTSLTNSASVIPEL